MTEPAIVTASEMSAKSAFIPEFSTHWGLVCNGKNVQMTWARFEPGVPYPMHKHDYEQVSILLEGQLRLTVGKLNRDITAGDVWYAPAGVMHGGEVIGNEAAVFLDIYAPPDENLVEFLRTHRKTGDD